MTSPLFGDGVESAVPDTTAVDNDSSLADKLVVAEQPAATHLSQKLAPGGGGGGCWLGGPRTASSDKWQADKQPKYSPFGKNLFGDDIQPNSGPLANKFTFPPFTVLSARDGDWQDRKRAWLALGIQSELGRGDATPGGRGANSAWEDGTQRDKYRDAAKAHPLGAMKKQYTGEGGNLPFADRKR